VQAGAEVQPILEHAEPPEPKPAVSGDVYTAQMHYDRANYNEAIWLDTKFAVTYENRGVNKNKMGDRAGADGDLTTTEAIQPRNSGKHIELGRLADASENNEAALTPKEGGAPEHKSPAKDARAFKRSIGVTIRRVTEGAALALNVKPARGALVAGIDQNGPAEAAGIEQGDVIVTVDGKDVKECRDLPRIVADTPAGKDVAVMIIRMGKELTKTVKIGWLEEPDEQASFTSQKGGAQQEKLVAVDLESGAAAKHLAPDLVMVEVQRQSVPSIPSTPSRFGKRHINHFSKINR